MTRRAWHLLAFLVVLAVVARGELAEAGSTVFGLLQITIGGVEQPGVGRLELPSGSTCDGGACTISGGTASNATGCVEGSIVNALNDAGLPECKNLVKIDNAGNLTLPVGATVDGRDISVDLTKLDGLPSSAVSQAQVSPADASIVPGYYHGQGYGSGADVGVRVQACTVQVPLNSTCAVRVSWIGKQVGDAATGLAPIASGDMDRVYHIRTTASAIAAVNVTVGLNDNNNLTGTYAHNTFDGAVFEPLAMGNGQPIWWTCDVLDIRCNAI